MLSDGCTMVRNLIQKNKNNPVYKAQLVDSLMTLYDQRVEYFPKYAVSSLNNKALDMYNYMKDEPAKLLEGLTEIIDQTKEQTRVNIFIFQLNTAKELYEIGMIDPETVIDIYDKGISYLEKMTPKNDVEARSIEKTLTDFESLFIQSKVASCENLIALFTPRVEADPQNLDLAKNIVRMLQITEGCVDNDLYLNAVNTIYRMEPSHNSAYYLFRLYASRRDIDNAIKFIEEALAYEDCDNETKAKYYFELAKTCSDNNRNSKAYDAAYKALEFSDVYDGKAYMLIAELWASAPCSGEISGRAKFWVATDFMVKAKNADPELASVADNAIGRYRAYFPKTDVAFMYDLTNGQGYTLSCGGMRASTTVRTNR
jgi:tetratricopeptide (TPR) repeat protein